jgi:hypothetical protein
LVALANAAGGPDNIAVVVLHCQPDPTHEMPTETVPASPEPSEMQKDFDLDQADPELLILGIEDLDVSEGTENASDGLLKALGNLVRRPGPQ